MQTTIDLPRTATIKAILQQERTKAVFCRVNRLGITRFMGRYWTRVDEERCGDVSTALFLDYKTERVFCPVHRRWEQCRPGPRRFSFVCQFEERFTGVPVLYVLPSLQCLRSQNREKQELMKRLRDRDREGVSNGVIRFAVETDFANCECTLTIDCVDYDHFVKPLHVHSSFPETYSHVYRYRFGHGLVADEAGASSGNPHPRPKEPRLPPIVSRYLENVALELAKVYAGREVTVNRSCYQGLPLLAALSHCPYEANMHQVLVADEWGTQSWLDPGRSDVYNAWCQHYHFKSCPKLRKAFDARPQALNEFQRLHDWGFRDVNLMMTAIKDYGDKITDLSAYQAKFFIHLSLKQRGEKATLKALFKDRGLDGRARNDIARMFHGYYYDLTPEEREQIIHDGFNRYNHNLLAKFSWKQKYVNQVFTYDKEQLELEDGKEEDNDEYLFRLPKDSYALHDIGAAMHNCVASYASNVLVKRSTIVYATHKGKYALCIEVVGKKVKQAVADFNSMPKGKAKGAFEKWCLRHDLHYSGVNSLHFGDGA